jgi:hypothetical protein
MLWCSLAIRIGYNMWQVNKIQDYNNYISMACKYMIFLPIFVVFIIHRIVFSPQYHEFKARTPYFTQIHNVFGENSCSGLEWEQILEKRRRVFEKANARIKPVQGSIQQTKRSNTEHKPRMLLSIQLHENCIMWLHSFISNWIKWELLRFSFTII